MDEKLVQDLFIHKEALLKRGGEESDFDRLVDRCLVALTWPEPAISQEAARALLEACKLAIEAFKAERGAKRHTRGVVTQSIEAYLALESAIKKAEG